MLSAMGDLGKALFVLRYGGFSVHLRGVKRGGGWGLAKVSLIL